MNKVCREETQVRLPLFAGWQLTLEVVACAAAVGSDGGPAVTGGEPSVLLGRPRVLNLGASSKFPLLRLVASSWRRTCSLTKRTFPQMGRQQIS